MMNNTLTLPCVVDNKYPGTYFCSWLSESIVNAFGWAADECWDWNMVVDGNKSRALASRDAYLICHA